MPALRHSRTTGAECERSGRFELPNGGFADLCLALKLEHDVNERWRVAAGYRAFEGGVDTDDVYNFGWFNYAVLGLEYRFGADGPGHFRDVVCCRTIRRELPFAEHEAFGLAA
jgi:hypothetical protein